MSVRDLTVYWGVSSGSTHAMMRRHYTGQENYQEGPHPSHLMINWQTQENGLWAGPRWMVDSGGAPDTIIRNRGHPQSIDDYLSYVRQPPTRYGDSPSSIVIDQFSLRDWPCEPEVRDELGLSVRELQERTLEDHITMMDRIDDMSLDADPVAVLQGWSVQNYLEAIDMYRDHGLITDKMAIGTLCGRESTQTIRTTAWKIARNLPGRVDLHGFGVKLSALREPDVLRIFDSIDTLAWDQSLRHATKDGVRTSPPGMEYDDWIDWDDRGNPRYTARNLWPTYRAYAEQLQGITPMATPDNVKVVTLDQLHQLTGDDRPEGQRVDEYILAECPCGNILDPGRPDPLEDEHGCRHCERAELDIWDRRLARREEVFAE